MTESEILFASLRTFLTEKVQPRLESYAAFENRIAVNLLGVLEREAAHREELAELVGTLAQTCAVGESTAIRDIAVGLRDGSITAQSDLIANLRRRALLQMAIDNPRYSGLKQGLERWPELAKELQLETRSLATNASSEHAK